MYYFYAIRSLKNNQTYKGISQNPATRLKEHNSGKTASTKPFRPFEMAYIEECKNRIEARKLEKYYKSGIGREKLSKLIKD